MNNELNRPDENTFNQQSQDGFLAENEIETNLPVDGMTDSDLLEAQTAETAYAGFTKNSIQKSTILLMVTCLLGVGGIFMFGMKNKPQEVSADDKEVEQKIEVALQKFTQKSEKEKAQKLFRDTENMIKSFYEYPAKQQVALDELHRDPFNHAATNQPTEDTEAIRLKKLRESLTQKVQALKLQSILQGPSGGKCLINGQVYSAGQKVIKTFTVKDIDESQVTLEAEGISFKLKM